MTHYPQQPLYAPAQPTNGLAIAGFVCSLVGLFGFGLLSPVGLVLSLVALGKPFGRGWAVAGIIFSLLGMCGWIVVIGLILAGVLAVGGLMFAALMLNEPEKAQVTGDMALIYRAVDSSEEKSGYLPASLESLGLGAAILTDPWGNAYHYVLDTNAAGFDIISDGRDGRPGTPDDIAFSKLDKLWKGTKFDVSVQGGKDGGSVVIDLGEGSLTVTGDQQGGRISLDTGEKIIEIKGDDQGGSLTATDDDTAATAGSEDGSSSPDESDLADDDAAPGESSPESRGHLD